MEKDLLTSELKGHRTLATVVFTDCVGFSARMSVDEDHTLDLIRRDLKLMKRICDEFEGRVLKSTGDGLLICFISAVKAVEYAIEIQKRLIERATKLPAQDSLQHRIGIHLADIFINETDVMGNGVNIAARLQTLAEPSGICISQTVYDVVKAGMNLETRYLGPQELKNIREVVPTYKIVLDPSAESADPYAEAIAHLEQSNHFLRIKKLLIYACKNAWENDPSRLSATNLRDLLHEVLRLAPTPERLQHFLDAAVKTLSKPAEYAVIANAVVEEVSKLYLSLQEQAQLNQQASQPVTETIATSQPSRASISPLYEEVAQELDQTGNQLRIKKLMYYVCRRRWENDANQLNSLRLPDLVAELHQRFPTAEQLRHTLNEFIQTLSKQTEYGLVGNAIASKFQRLYTPVDNPDATQAGLPGGGQATEFLIEPERPPVHVIPGYGEIAANLEQEPNVLRVKKLILYVCRRQWESDSAKLNRLNFSDLLRELHQLTQTREQLELALNAVARSLNKRDEYAAIARAVVIQMSPLYPDHREPDPEPPAESVAPAPSATPDEPIRPTSPPDAVEVLDEIAPAADYAIDPINLETPLDNPQKTFTSLFDYRLGIMKYTNPLRTKILLFSALHGDFDYSDQDWLNLKMHELDGLMRHLLKSCKFYTELEALLYGTARRLHEPEENVQTATAVIRCLRPLYLHKALDQDINDSTENTRMSLDDFEETTLEIGTASDEDEFTCQLLTSSLSSANPTELSSAETHSPTPNPKAVQPDSPLPHVDSPAVHRSASNPS